MLLGLLVLRMSAQNTRKPYSSDRHKDSNQSISSGIAGDKQEFDKKDRVMLGICNAADSNHIRRPKKTVLQDFLKPQP